MATAFEQLGSEVRQHLAAQGLSEPTEPQQAAIPLILAGRDVLLIAPTGAGKTEAALLPALDRLARLEHRAGISLLYITPLRALNRDMERRLRAWGERLQLRVEVRHGDTPDNVRRKQAARPPDILVTTPETLQAILPAKVMRRHLRHVRCVIVDEVHNLARERRGIQLTLGLERLREVAGPFQRIGLSATVGDPADVAAMFGGEHPLEVVQPRVEKAMRYRVEWPKPNDGDFELSRELFISPEVASVLTVIRDEVEAHRASLVFVNSRLNAELLGSRLPVVVEGVGVHHGSLPREARESAEHAFKDGKLKALVATSTLELGIDIGSVDRALQYQSPRQVSSLIQRVGRAGHDLRRVSEGTIVVNSADDVLESVAIVRRAQRGALEALKLHRGARDVLGHQLVGMALDEGGRVPRDRALALARRAEPFRDADAYLDRVADFMAHLRYLRREGPDLVATGKARDYYFRNLSTIRDERTYPVVDVTQMKPVGILGEEEMMLRARKGYRFVIRGRTWNILQVGADGAVYVEPVVDPTARIPAWDGPLMPVPYEVAQDMAALRAEMGRALAAEPLEQVVERFAEEWPANKSAVRRVAEQLEAQLKAGAPVPGADEVLVEAFDRFLVVHAPFGDVVNEALADVLEEQLARKNLVRFWWFDPYRVMLELAFDTRELDVPALARELLVMEDAKVQEMLEAFLTGHLPMGYHLKGVAERMGAIPRGLFIGSEDLQSFEVRFKGSVVAEEAMREVRTQHIDLDRMRDILARLRTGALKLGVHKGQGPSPLAYHIVRRYLEVPELVSPEADREANVDRMAQFLRTELVTLLCFRCGALHPTLRAGELPERPACAQCASPVLGALTWHGKPIQQALQARLRGEPIDEEAEKELVRARQGADLVAVHGKKAVLALCVFGVGPQAAAKVLARMHPDEKQLYRDLYEAKLRYVLNRQYWDKGRGGPREPATKPWAYSQKDGASTERRL